MRQFKKTAIAVGVAQIAFMSSGAMAQDAANAAPGTAVVVVTGQRAALQSAQKIKQNSDEIVDSIVADDIGKLPDRSVTEVLQRIVGVTMDRSMSGDPQHYAVEGSGIAVRGLSYVRSELNGRDSFSANGGRALNFEDVPPELMAGVDLYKNPSAEQIEGGISGLVNLRTATPFDYKGLKGAVSAQTSYAKMSGGKLKPSASAMISNRWVTPLGEFGVLLDYARSKSATTTDAIQIDPFYPRTDLVPGKTVWVPKGALWRTTYFDRDRQGEYAAFQWRPFREMTNTLTFFRSRYHMTWSEQALLMQHPTPYKIQVENGKYDANGVFQSGILSDPLDQGLTVNPDRRVADRDSQTTDIAWNTVWRITPKLTMKVDLQSIKASTNGFDSDVATGLQIPKENLDLTTSPATIKFDQPTSEYLANKNSYFWAYTMSHLDIGSAASKALKIDLNYDFDHPFLRDIRFGVRGNNRSARTQNSGPSSYNWQGVTQPWMVGTGANNIKTVAYLGDSRFGGGTTVHVFDNFMGGKTTVPAIVFPDDNMARGYPGTYDLLHSYRDSLCADGQVCTPYIRSTFSPTDYTMINDVSEKARAAYTQLRFGFDDLKYPIDGNIGIRVVRTNLVAAGYTSYSPPTPITTPVGGSISGVPVPVIAAFAIPNDYDNSYNKVLPTMNLRMKYSDKLQFRLGFGTAMSRPDFNQMQGSASLNESWSAIVTPAQLTADNHTIAVPGHVEVTSVSLGGNADGNPRLKPIMARQIDLTAEWYFAQGSSLTFAIFNKDLKDVIVSQMSTLQHADVNGKLQTFTVSSPTNGALGKARGFEVAYQQYYDNLPSWMSGFGTQASFTFVNSKRTLYRPITNAYCSSASDAVGTGNLDLYTNGCDTDGRTFSDLPLVGLSRTSANLALMYDKGPLSMRLAYNWRSRYLQAVNTWGARGTDGKNADPANLGATVAYGLPLWAASYGQLDGSIFFKLTDKLQIGLEAQNLNNAVFKQEMQQHAITAAHAWFVTGPRYTAQMRYSF
jgi:iron complex outermembrane receptor protein